MSGRSSKRKGKSRYSMFVWHEVLYDYTSGMIVIMARNEQHAREIWVSTCKSENRPWRADELDGKAPIVYPANAPAIAYVYGGG